MEGPNARDVVRWTPDERWCGMTDDGGIPDPQLPDDLIDRLDSLDVAALHAVVDYAEARLAAERSSIAEDVRAEAGDDVVRIDDQGGYAVVERRRATGADGEAGDGTTSLYLVRHERDLEGNVSLGWSFLRDAEAGGP